MESTDLVKWALPELEACRTAASALRRDNPGIPAEELAVMAVKRAKKVAAVGGAVAGAVTSPVTMVPAAMMDIANTLKAEGQMAGIVAALLDPESLKDKEAFEADVLAIVFASSVSQALKEVGVQAGVHATKTLIRKYVSKGVLKALVRFAAKYLGIKLTQRAIITKTIPLVGGALGAGWNWLEVKTIGSRAIRYHRNGSIG